MWGYLGSVGDLLKRSLENWALNVMAVLFAVAWLYDTFVRPQWEGSPPVLEAIVPFAGWLLLITFLWAISLAYHQLRMESRAAPAVQNNYTFNFPPGQEGVELYRAVSESLGETIESKSEVETKAAPQPETKAVAETKALADSDPEPDQDTVLEGDTDP